MENTRLQNLANSIKSTIDGSESQQVTTESVIEHFQINKPPEEPPLQKNTNRAQQLINQIEISLNQNAKPVNPTNSNFGGAEIRPPSTSSDFSRRFQLPKKSILLNSRNINNSNDVGPSVRNYCNQEYKSTLDDGYALRINALKNSEVSSFNPMIKTDRNNLPYEEGKSFFREARRILPFDKFNAFRQEIKLLNRGQKTKEEVIKMSEELFTKENMKMVSIFRQLLSNSKANGSFN